MSSETQATARPTGPRRSFLGLVWSLVPVLLILGFLVWWQKADPTPVTTVDPRPDITYAQRVSPVPLPGLGPVPGDWRATSSHVDAPGGEQKVSPVTLTIGYLTENDKFAEVVIGDRPVATLLVESQPQSTKDGTVQVGATTWNRYRNTRGEVVLAGTVGRAGVLVTGDASAEDLTELAAAVGAPG